MRNAAAGIGLALLACLGGCGGSELKPVTDDAREPLRDFSGRWEVDFSASDTVRNQIITGLKRSQREGDRSRRASTGNAAGIGFMMGGGSNSGVSALAEMAELVTEPQLLEVRQTPSTIQVRRENSFALICDLTQPPPVVTVTPAGRETCIWSGRQIKFRIDLPEGLRIEHQLLLSEDRRAIAFNTSMTSSQVREPLAVRKIFTRFNPQESAFRCVDTVTRGRVCTTEPESSP